MKKVIGIIGSKEKSIVSAIISSIFQNEECSSKIISSEDLRKQEFVNKKNIEKAEDVDVLIIEIDKSNIKTIIKSEIELDIIVEIDMTLDKYRKDDYFNDKVKLVKDLKQHKLLIVNTDDENSIKLSYENQQIIVLAYGLNGRSSLTASSLDLDNKIKFNLCLQRTIKTLFNSYVEPFEYPMEVNLVGVDNLYCVFAAVSVALYFNIELETIIKTFLRLELGGIKVI